MSRSDKQPDASRDIQTMKGGYQPDTKPLRQLQTIDAVDTKVRMDQRETGNPIVLQENEGERVGAGQNCLRPNGSQPLTASIGNQMAPNLFRTMISGS